MKVGWIMERIRQVHPTRIRRKGDQGNLPVIHKNYEACGPGPKEKIDHGTDNFAP